MKQRHELLVVDDEPDIRAFLTDLLVSEGYSVVTAADGEEALERIRDQEFEVVISDVRMPGIDGVEVLRAIKQLAPETEVVITTGYASIETAVDCLRAGAADFVQKPIDLEQLLATVAHARQRRHLRAATALYQASQAVFDAHEPDRLAETVVEVTTRIMAADEVALYLPDTDGGLRLAQGTASALLDDRVIAQLAGDRSPTLIPDDIEHDARFIDLALAEGLPSSIVYPLASGDRLVGVLSLSRRPQAAPYRRPDLDRASILASQVLLAIENVRLLRAALAAERLATIGRLAGGIAHELANPLSYLGTNLDYLREGLDEAARRPEEVRARPRQTDEDWWLRPGAGSNFDNLRRAADDAGEAAGQMRDILRDLRSLARAEETQPVAFDPNEAIRSALRVASVEIRARAQVVTHFGQDLWVVGNAGRLSQVFIQVLVAAAHAIAARPGELQNDIVVTTRRDGDDVIAQVSDSGPAAEQVALRLGEPVSRETVRRHGGDLRVDSAPGRATTFTIRLPAAASVLAAASKPEAARAERAAPARRPRVLFIDDEPGMLRSYQRSFERDHDVAIALGGPQALAILERSQDFDLIVCDLIMPRMSGMILFERVRATYPPLESAFLFISGNLSDEKVKAFVRTIDNLVIEKPCDLDIVREMLAERTRVGA